MNNGFDGLGYIEVLQENAEALNVLAVAHLSIYREVIELLKSSSFLEIRFEGFDGAVVDRIASLNEQKELVILPCYSVAQVFGMAIAANKIKGIRACSCSDMFSAELTRRHNNANVLCLCGRVIGTGLAEKMVDLFLNTLFEGGWHKRRIDKILEIEKHNFKFLLSDIHSEEN